MKRFVLLALILFASFAPGLPQGQKNRVSLTGSVQGITTRCIKGERYAEVRVYLQFHNDTPEPVILYYPSFLFKATMNYSTSDSSGGGNVVDSFSFRPDFEDPWAPPTENDYDQHKDLPSKLKKGSPSTAGFVTIEPGGYYEFFDTLWPKSGFKIDFIPSKMPPGLDSNGREFWLRQPCGVGRTTVTPEYRSFRIKYDLHLRKYAGATDLLRNLQSRWRTFGNLILASNDDIMFETDDILLDARK